MVPRVVGSSPISHPTSKPRTSVWGFFDADFLGIECAVQRCVCRVYFHQIDDDTGLIAGRN